MVVDEWMRSMRARGLSAGTLAARRSTFRTWSTFIGDRIWQADHHDVEQWLSQRHLAPKTAHRQLSDLTTLYRWARREGLSTADPTLLIEPRRLPRATPRPAPSEAVHRALRSPDRRTSLAVALMAYGGLRCAEVAALTTDDIDLDAGAIYVTGKGGHQRWVPIIDPMRPYLMALDGAPPGSPAFPNRLDAGHVSAGSVSRVINTWLRDCNDGRRLTAHQLRHWYAAQILARSNSLELVQLALGHASIATTQIYARLPSAALARITQLWSDEPAPVGETQLETH
jgi:site-specific recombinase XerD